MSFFDESYFQSSKTSCCFVILETIIMKLVLSLLITVLVSLSSFAQDQIIKKDGKKISCKITEIGLSEIKYYNQDNLQGPLYSIGKEQVQMIVFENGKKEQFNSNDDLKNWDNYPGQLTKAIKLNFFSPLIGYSEFSFEKQVAVGKSYELSLGIIGLGRNNILEYNYATSFNETKKNQFGVFVSGGYKFSKLPDFLFGRTRFTHIMQGAYIKPILYLGTYSENRIAYKASSQYEIEKQQVNFGALHLEFGKQWVFSNKVLLDGYWGLGYGFDNKLESNSYTNTEATAAYNYANTRLGTSPGLSFSFGIKLGMLIQ